MIKLKKMGSIALAVILLITSVGAFASCGNASKFDDSRIVIVEKSESELRELTTVELDMLKPGGQAWIGTYTISGKLDHTEIAPLGSVCRQYYKIVGNKLHNQKEDKYHHIEVTNNSVYALPIDATDFLDPVLIDGVTLFELDTKCSRSLVDGVYVFEFDKSETEIRGMLEELLGSTYKWDTFNKFEIKIVEEGWEQFYDYASDSLRRTAHAIWSTSIPLYSVDHIA